MLITNRSDISLPLAVWLVTDDYDYINEPGYISATSLMKPLRSLVLNARVPAEDRVMDIEELIPSAMGRSMHDSIEKSWTVGYRTALKKLGYPEDVIEQIAINPTDEQLRNSNSIIPIYLEQRAFRQITVRGKTFTIGGKFDLVTEGIVQDAKSTSTYAWTKSSKDDDYRLQMSLYRWIDAGQPRPKITEDFGKINFIFTDWQKFRAKSDPNYPQSRVRTKDIALLSVKEVESWIESKLTQILRYQNAPESEIPECTDEELWRSDPVHKYYADPLKTSGRATRNFDTDLAAANAFKAEKGKGVVITIAGEPKRCAYCPAFSVCSQKDRYFS